MVAPKVGSSNYVLNKHLSSVSVYRTNVGTSCWGTSRIFPFFLFFSPFLLVNPKTINVDSYTGWEGTNLLDKMTIFFSFCTRVLQTSVTVSHPRGRDVNFFWKSFAIPNGNGRSKSEGSIKQ